MEERTFGTSDPSEGCEGIDRRTFLATGGALVAVGLSDPADAAERWVAIPGAATVRRWPGYDRAMVIDALASPIQFNIPQEGLPLSAEALADVRASGVTAVNLTAGVVGATAPDPFDGSVARMAAWEREIDAHPDFLCRVRTHPDLLRAKRDGLLGIIYGFQDAVPLEGRLERLDLFHGLGLRIVQLTYNDRNRLGDGCLEPANAGLSRLGVAAIERMGELGILVDLSHCGRRTTAEGIRVAPGPVAVTHSGCNALFDHPRNKDDATLRTLADRGGVIGIYLMPFLNPAGAPTTEDVVRHIEHALDVCGADHVGIGSDQGVRALAVDEGFHAQFEVVSARRQAMGIAAPREDTIPYVPELNHPRRLDTLADALSLRGHSDRVIEKVLGANFARLFESVWG